MSNIKEDLKKAYDLLPDGYRKRATEIHGVEYSYFIRIVKGLVKGEDTYHLALQAVKQAAKEAVEDAESAAKEIEVIGEENLSTNTVTP